MELISALEIALGYYPKSTVTTATKNIKKTSEYFCASFCKQAHIPPTDTRFTEPRYVSALLCAVKTYLHTQQEYTKATAIALLAEYYSTTQEHEQAILLLALKKLPYCTEEMLKTLALSFSIMDSVYACTTYNEFLLFLQTLIFPLHQNTPITELLLNTLESVGAVHYTTTESPPVLEVLRHNYAVFFTTGFNTLSMYNQPLYTALKKKGFVTTCVNNSAFEQFSFLNSASLTRNLQKGVLTQEEYDFVLQQQESTLFTTEEVEAMLTKIFPAISEILATWEQAGMQSIQGTTIGKMLAIAYIKSIGHSGYTFSTWLS